MTTPRRVLIFHTAFPGDLVLTVPMIEAVHEQYSSAQISVVVVPSAAGLLLHHPAVHDLIVYDKRGEDRGLTSLIRLARRLRGMEFDTAIVPHKSLRSALIVRLAKIPVRIGFTTSAGRFLMSDLVRYDRNEHEVKRNLSLLHPLGIDESSLRLPRLYPDDEDRKTVDSLFPDQGKDPRVPVIVLAPGSKWNTKRWPAGYFSALGRLLMDRGLSVVLIGGREDSGICGEITAGVARPGVINTAGKLTLLQSAEVIRRATLVVSNDSAPVHLGVAMRTPVLALFGPTVPAFGFAPIGENDEVIQREGLSCRPCSIHGGATCPIRTFVCMRELTPDLVFSRVLGKVGHIPEES